MSLKFTKNRKVELFDIGGHQFAPPVFLPPLTEVEVTSSEFSLRALAQRGITFVQVRVTSHPLYRNRTGVLPFGALDDLSLSTFAYDRGRTSFTGLSYGGDVLLWDGAENQLWKPNCPFCGADPESHRLLETRTGRPDTGNPRIRGTLDKANTWTPPKPGERSATDMVNYPRGQGTLADVLVLYDALKTKGGSSGQGFGQGARVMIGVLHCEDDTVFAGYSGPKRMGFDEVAKHLGFIPATTELKIPLRNRTRQVAAYALQKQIDELTCAAPRLIQTAIGAGKWPYAMSEVWFDPNSKHAKYPDKHTIESCDRCRGTVPLMLCPQ